ncbi:MAG: hypothetical protein NDJ90_07935 [Oligoflexia bacterium]|nr:hypothetical protein [Oligoflexia bacterium]
MKGTNRFSISITGSLILLLALSRCSPLSPSVAKSMLGTQAPVDPIVSVSEPAVSPGECRIEEMAVQGRFMDKADFDSQLVGLPEGTLLRLDEEQLQELSATGKTLIPLQEMDVASGLRVLIQVPGHKKTLRGLDNAMLHLKLERQDELNWNLRADPAFEEEEGEAAKTLLSVVKDLAIVFGATEPTE